MILLAFALSLDAFAVSVTSGVTIKNLKIRNAFKIAAFFGGFQALMPVVGYLAGKSVNEYIKDYDHWIAFGLLVFIGVKMIWEAFKIEECELDKDCLNSATLLLLAIATSIDALGVGLIFSSMAGSIVFPVILIGLITFIVCFAGVYIGDKIGSFFENKIEIVGGVILIGIGIRLLYLGLTGAS